MPAIPEYIPLSKGKALFAVASWRSGSTTNTPACTAANLTDNDGKAGTHVNSGDVTKNNNNNNHTNNNNNGKASTNSRGNNTRSGTRGRNGRRGGAGGHGGKDNSGRSAAPAAADVDDFFVHILFPGDAQVDSFHFDLKAQATPLRVFDIGKRRPLLPRSAGEGRGRDAAASSASHSHTNRLVSDSNRVTDEDTSRHASSNPINHHGAARGRAGEADDSSPVQAPNQDDVEVVAAHEGGSNHRALCGRDAATSAQARSPACVSTLIEVSEHDAASEGGEGAKEHFSPTSPCAGGEVSPLQTASAAAAAAAATGNSPGDAVPQMQLPPAEILPETHRTSSLLSYHRSCNGDSNSVNVGEEGAGDVEYKEYDSPNREAEKVRRSSSSSDVENEVSPSLAAVSSNGAASGPATTRTTTTSVHDKEQEELQDDYLISLLFAENEEAQSAASLIARRWPQAKVEVVARNRATLSASLVLKFMPTLIKTSEAVEELATFPHKPSYVRLYRSTRNVYQNVLFVKYPNREAAEDSKLRLMRCYIKTHPLKVDFKRRYNNGGGAGGGTEAGESATDTKPLPQMIRELRVSNEHEGVAFKRADLSRDELKTLKQLCQSYDLIFEMNDQRVTARRQLKGSGPSKSISPALRPQGVAGCHSTPSWAPTTPAPLRPMDFKGISHWKDMQNQSNSLGIIRPIGPGSGVAAFSAGRGRQI